ncbi:PQQ-binding-like beta-propeller repeat protein [Paenibacillus sp. M1]|uniref:PQQ-binding-like beta-propeller repeat protein n=1 Tax=Paenibacillus haidiansis TaxID=1574488 RepID=A0ABU7VV93_9BACL
MIVEDKRRTKPAFAYNTTSGAPKPRGRKILFLARLILAGVTAAGAVLPAPPTVQADKAAPIATTGTAPQFVHSSILSGSSAALSLGGLSTSGLFPTLPKQGDTLTLRHEAPLFPGRVNAKSDPRRLNSAYFGQAGERMTVQSVAGEMISAPTYDKGTIWVPLWYFSEASEQMTDIPPQYVTLRSGAKLSLAPSSSVRWDKAGYFTESRLVAMAKWNEWYGVMATPAAWHNGYQAYRPILLWVNKKDIERTEEVPTPLLAQGSDMPLETVRGIVDLTLKQGDHADTVEKLLGPPAFKETSEDLQMEAGQTMILGPAWRYERRDAQFRVSFLPSGELARTEWTIPASGEPHHVYSGDSYMFTNNYAVTPLPRTLDIAPEWKNGGTLGFTYLLGAGSDVLLLMGDDGGFSGMHYNSSLYAVGRRDGETWWRLDAGFGGMSAALEQSGEYAVVFTSYSPEKGKYENRVRRIRLSDGETMWERNYGDDSQMGMWAADNSVVLLASKNTAEAGKAETAVISVLDGNTGRERWHKTVGNSAQILNKGANDPFVLVREKGRLTAYEPATGKQAWQLQAEGEQKPDYSFEPYFAGGARIDPFAGPDADRRWILLGSTWKLLDLKTGNIHGEYPYVPGERFEVLNERYLLVEHPLDKADYYGAERFETRLYDVAEGRTKFSIPGKGAKGTLADGTLYLVVDGIPTAVEIGSGNVLWRMSNNAAPGTDLSRFAAGSFAVLDQTVLYPFGSDLLALDKRSGAVLGRLRDVRTGYAELREQETRGGTLNLSGDELYVGTANGGFFRFGAAALERELGRISKE